MRIPLRGSLLALALLLFLLAGCGTDNGLALYEGGGWEYSSVVTLSAEQEAGAQGDEIRSLIADRWSATSGQPVAFETRREVDGERTRYHFVASGTDFAQLAPYLSEPSAVATVRQATDGALSLAIPLQAAGEPSVIFPTEGEFAFNLSAGQIISSNATQVEDGRAIWRSQDVRDRGLTAMEATVRPGARSSSTQRPLLIGGAILAGLALLAIAFVAGRSRSRATPRTVEPLPPVAATPVAPERAAPTERSAAAAEKAAPPPPTERKP